MSLLLLCCETIFLAKLSGKTFEVRNFHSSGGLVGQGALKHKYHPHIYIYIFFVLCPDMESKVMQTPKGRSGSSELPKRVSPRQLNVTALDSDSASSSNQSSRTPKDKSTKVVERRSPKSPVSELQKKRADRLSELESQLSQLQEDLKKAKDQLNTSESWKKRAQQDADESKKQLSITLSKLEESQQQIQELSASKESRIIELQKISEERNLIWQSELEALQNQHSADSEALASATNEIQRLNVQLDRVTENEATHTELQSLTENLAESHSLVEDMKQQLRDCKESEAKAQALVSETLLQLEGAKRNAETLRLDGIKAVENYNLIASELDRSKVRVNLLEGLANKLQADLAILSSNCCQDPSAGDTFGLENGQNEKITKLNKLESEVGRLRYDLEIAEVKYLEEEIRSIVQIRNAYELVEQMQSISTHTVAELEKELEKRKTDIEELKANLMDKETELQAISEENEVLNSKLEKNQREYEVDTEVKKSREDVEELKANLMDKETEFQNISEENEILKLELRKRETDTNDEVVAGLEAAKREALMKLGYVMEEAEKSSKRVEQVAEQLEAAQAARSEMEAELRRLKVQSDQWRKAAEAAATMLSAGNQGKFMERSGSLDSNYNPVTGKLGSPYAQDMDNDSPKKKNGNMLKKIGVLWKKPHK